MQTRDCKENRSVGIKEDEREHVKKADRSAKLFSRLRGEMVAHDIENGDIAYLLERTPMHISRCLNGRAEFTLSKQYKIMHLIGWPAEKLDIVFPENGVGADSKERNTEDEQVC